MRIIVRFIVFVATLIGVVALIIGGIYLGTGSLDFLERIGIEPTIGTLEIAPASSPEEEVTPSASGSGAVIQFIWRGSDILYNDNLIDEGEFAELLAAAKANDSKVEIIKMSDVRVETADRWREMLDEAGVRYEVIPQE